MPNADGGNGAYTYGELELQEGEVVYIYVGGEGGYKAAGSTGYASGGWNGGGNGYVSRTNCSQQAAGGGGATDIRIIGGPADFAGSGGRCAPSSLPAAEADAP